MIHYKRDTLKFFFLMLLPGGSVLPRAIPVALASGAFCFFLLYFGWLPQRNSALASALMAHPSPYAFFLQVAALIIAFHTNSAYQRFWEARSQLQNMSSYWGDAASHIVAFDELPIYNPENANQQSVVTDCYKFRSKMLHYFSLLHAVCIHYLLNKDTKGLKLEILGGLNKEELSDLTIVTDHSFLVQYWINQALARRLVLEGGLTVGGPVLSRTWQLLYLGMVSYNQACKIEDTPFPFPYIQLMYLFDISVMILTPIVIASWVPHIPFAVCLSFLIVLSFHSLFQAAYLMESPFGQRPNDLPLLDLHHDFISRLKILIDTSTATELYTSVLNSVKLNQTSMTNLQVALWPIGQTPVITELSSTDLKLPRTSDVRRTRLRTSNLEQKNEPSTVASSLDVSRNAVLSCDAGLPVASFRRIGSSNMVQNDKRVPNISNNKIDLMPQQDIQKRIEALREEAQQ